MKRFLVVTVPLAVLLLISAGCSVTTGDAKPSSDKPVAREQAVATPGRKTLRAFASDQELSGYLHDIAEKQRQSMRARKEYFDNYNGAAPVAKLAAPAPSAVAGVAAADESVTNVQHAGVDEGSIVKVHGDHLVVLRRGRLFTVDINDRALTPISAVDAFGPDIDPNGTWYDEMLVSQNTIAVIGYSYARGGTEVGLFDIDRTGKLEYRSTYHLRSNDYYSSRNYASRLIGTKLIFYVPMYLNAWTADPFGEFPAVRKWHRGATPSEFKRIVPATQVYRVDKQFSYDAGLALHTVTICDLARGDFDCKATSIVGPPGRVFYVSPESVYIWVTSWDYQSAKSQSQLYRMPLDGSAPTALGVSGSPVDQFSFLESEDHQLNVLVRSGAFGDSMWGAENASGPVALMRVPLDSFSDGSASVPDSNYLKLPTPSGYAFENRFVGDYLLYGAGSGWGYPQPTQKSHLYAVRWATGDWTSLTLAHGVDRIEALGSDAVVVGSSGRDLHFTSVRLGDVPAIANEFVRIGASQGELRSHGFFYKPDGRESGMLGLPISTPARAGSRHLFDSSAAILFLRNDGLHFQEVGELEAHPDSAKDDACRASCVDWYGNSQPLFVHGRVLALLGYELVEGSFDHGRIFEAQRVNYAPPPQVAWQR